MDTGIEYTIDKIAKYRDADKIRFIRTLIGQYRLNAMRNYGYVRWYIHQQANEIENLLNRALNAYKNKTSR